MNDSKRLFDGALFAVALAGVIVAIMAGVAVLTRPDPVVIAAPVDAATEVGTDDEMAEMDHDEDGDAAPAAVAEVRAHVTLAEFSIEGDLIFPPGEVVLEMHNEGGIQHNLKLEGLDESDILDSGTSGEYPLGNLAAGEYELICNIPGHKEAGMITTVVVDADASVDDLGATHDDHDEAIDWEALDEVMLASIAEFPAATEGVGNAVLEPVIDTDGTKVFDLTAAITPWEVEPGKIVDAWTYNGIVPGPIIKIDVGDRVRVNLQNDLPMGTDIHWHGVRTPNDMDGVSPITQDLIRSGESFVYEFTAENPAVGMYHAHHHGHVQIPNGMFGVMQIGEIPLPLGRTIGGVTFPDEIELALEMPMVLNDAGVIGFSLNGKSFPATAPVVVNTGDWVLVHYYNEGLQIHPMHQHQFPQLVVAKDGFPLDNPYFADTVNVAPGERYSVLVHADTPGVWVWHCHILTHVERDEGMFGMVTAMVVQDPEG